MKTSNTQSIEIINVPIGKSTGLSKASSYTQAQQFKFDWVFNEHSTQAEIFKEIADLVRSAMDGYKVCIFSYGQTGSGKTYTMEGDIKSQEHQGMIPRAVTEIFNSITEYKTYGWDFKITCTFQEIYLETIRDLLDHSNYQGTHNKDYAATVLEVQTPADIEEMMKIARQNRKVASTKCNDVSSRSHSIFELNLIGSHAEINGGAQINGALNLIDLAGSERLAQSGAEGVQLKETQAINKSLSFLGNVISQIASKEKHIQFRNSKLTQVLQPHLNSESAKVLMIVNVSPLGMHASETINSLRFASKVNTCVIGEKSKKKTVI